MSFKLKDMLKSTPDVMKVVDECPTGKTPYASKAAARDALKEINRKQRTKMKAFRCGYCMKVHLGHPRGSVY